MIDEEFLQQSDAESARRAAVIRQICIEAGRLDVLAQYDAAMRMNRLGLTGARATWHSISPAQRAALVVADAHGGRLMRQGKEYRHRDRHQPYKAIHVATIRNLCARELLAWDGGAFEPEAAAVVTERGRFVLKRGPMPNGERFMG